MVPHVLFDVDGVLVDNTAYETAVQRRIWQHLADSHGIDLDAACNVWVETVLRHRDHRRRHDYAVLCGSLSLGDVWQDAHRASLPLLQLTAGAIEAIAVAQRMATCWIASDSTDWVIRLKLGALGLLDQFPGLLSLDSCGSHKGTPAYWQAAANALGDGERPVIYVDDRPSCLVAAQATLRSCICVLVESVRPPGTIDDEAGGPVPPQTIATKPENLALALTEACVRLRKG